jgi:serine/threonine-protein kinase HipA
LANSQAVEIDPVELKLSTRTYETARLNGVFSALRDAGPDYWGRRVVEKHAGKTQLRELDYLLESPDDRAGALGFGLNSTPPAPRRKFNKTMELEKLQALADTLVKDARELFRRVCFNAPISNIDDHPRNHAIIANERS